MLLALIKDRNEGSPLDVLRKNEAGIIQELYPELKPRLQTLQNFPNLSLVDVEAVDLNAMHDNITKYHLRPRDALHLAAMHKADCLNIVSQDSDFDHITGIQRYILA